MISFPNAKINLGLNIISKREDGYHNLETVFYPIGLKDALEIVPSAGDIGESGYRFFTSGDLIEGDPDSNLVVKALKLIFMHSGKELPPVDIHLLKKIPSGAGLGGGSSDAAFMLKMANDFFEFNYTIEELMQIAAKIGADCPFFLINKPVFASGIGDIMVPVGLDLSRYYFVLVKPDIEISTKEAYAMVKPATPEISIKEIVKKPITEWKGLMKNDFEESIFKKYPQICSIKNQLYEAGAVYASMSGSGSSVYGIFESEPDLQNSFNKHYVWFSGPES